MSPRRPPRNAVRHRRPTARGAVVVAGAALLGAVGYQASTSESQSLASSPVPSLASAPPTAAPASLAPAPPPGGRNADRPEVEGSDAHGLAGGDLPDGTTVFDDGAPGIAKLDPALRDALRRAATDAAGGGVRFEVNSGWRSRAYQERLFREAVAKYGSEAEAARWVAPPDRSAHVTGDAVDIGGSGATTWLSRHGAAYGLCQIYDNEPWHYELRPAAATDGCPRRYADTTHDPRMQ